MDAFWNLQPEIDESAESFGSRLRDIYDNPEAVKAKVLMHLFGYQDRTLDSVNYEYGQLVSLNAFPIIKV